VRRDLLIGALLLATSTAVAAPTVIATRAPLIAKPRHDGAHARVEVRTSGVMRPAREAVGRREEPLTAEEDTAKQIEKLLHGPLRYTNTGIYVADARTGEPMFAVNADDPLNPASNVKMISTATALELMGPGFKYATRLLGPEPDAQGTIHGNVYLLGTWDPTLVAADLDELGAQLAARGVKALDGDVVVGNDPMRDGLFRAVVPIDIKAGAPGEAPTATTVPGFDLVTFKIDAKTAATVQRPHLTYTAESIKDAAGHTRVELSIHGTLGKGGATTYGLVVKERTFVAAHVLRASLHAHQIAVAGDVSTEELGDFIGDAAGKGGLPVELARHESMALSDIITRVNKWSINWLADRVIMTTTALAHREPPSMDRALEAMYGWLARHPHVDKADALLDSGSGLSYHTRISARELVAVLRSAAGFSIDADVSAGTAWLGSLSIGGTDGTLHRRFRTPEVKGHIHAKTGTLSTVIALTGVLDFDPQRPLAFSIITNGDRPLQKGYVRRAHEQLVGLLVKYLAKTAKTPVPTIAPQLPTTLAPATTTKSPVNEDLDEEPEAPLDDSALPK
jgi:D-alanyl-D-alanine carboxypeptidase/D-alanyl-D-alanine-endopeptidase (penicillin-binding protein 4)